MRESGGHYHREVITDAEDSLSKIVNRIRPGTKVLDVGCGSGALGRYLQKEKDCYVVGIDVDDEFAKELSECYNEIHFFDMEKGALSDHLSSHSTFDYIVCADIVEHLRYPEILIDQLSAFINDEGMILFSIPNIAYIGVLLDLLDGKFNYTDTGILDKTHLKFYTYDSICDLLTSSGFLIQNVDRVQVDLALSEFSIRHTQSLPPALVAYVENVPESSTYQYIVEVVLESQYTKSEINANASMQSKVAATSTRYATSVYWSVGGEPFVPSRSAHALATVGDYDQLIQLDIPVQKHSLTGIRFDPADRPGTLFIDDIEVRSVNNILLWRWSDEKILPALETQHQVILSEEGEGMVCLIAGQDPHFLLPLSDEVLEAASDGCAIQTTMSWPKSSEYDVIIAKAQDALRYQRTIVRLNQDNLNSVQRENCLTKSLERLEELSKELNKELTLTKVNNEVLQHATERLAGKLALIQQSRAWKVVQSLKLLRAFCISCWDLVSGVRYNMNVVRVAGVIESGDSDFGFQSIDSDPQYHVAVSDSILLLGWYKVEVQSKAERKHTQAKLYVDAGEGFTELSSYKLVNSQGGVLSAYVWIPASTVGIRIDPIDQVGKFSFHGVSIAPVSFIEIAWRYSRILLNSKKLRYSYKEALLKSYRSVRDEGLLGYLKRIRRLLKTGVERELEHQEWFDLFQGVDDNERRRLGEHSIHFEYRPKISVVMPVYNVSIVWLVKAIESVGNQIYENWELCIANDASTDSSIAEVLNKYQKDDARIKVVHRMVNGHISVASNSALELVTGEYVALLDHDDEFTEDALYRVVQALNERKTLNIIYSDEDLVDEAGGLYRPHFKSSWNPDLFHCQNYLCHLMVYRTELIRSVGGFREGVEGAQDFDLALRCTTKVEEGTIHHIPRILYHWRAIEGSTAKDLSEKDYATAAGIKALEDYFAQVNPGVIVERGPWPTTYRPRYPIPFEQPSVTLVIPNKDAFHILQRCINSILSKTVYSNYSILIVDNGSSDEDALDYLEELKKSDKISVVRYDEAFNFSAINNYAVELCDSEIVGLLNNDLEVIAPDWLAKMVSNVIRPEIGVVGAKLYYPNDTIQHAGVILGLGPDGVAGHSHKTFDRVSRGYIGRLCLPQNLSAVTAACLLVRKSTYLEVGGLDEERLKVAFNDVDFCLKVRAAGYRVYWEPDAELYHYESATRGYEDTPEKKARFEEEKHFMHEKWGEILCKDPYYSPNLTREFENFSIAWPPRLDEVISVVVSNKREIV